MRTLLALLPLVALAAPAGAQQVSSHAGHPEVRQPADPHAIHGMGRQPAESHGTCCRSHAAPPEAAFSGPRHAADRLFGPAAMAAARRQLRSGHGGMPAYGLLVERFEMPIGEGGSGYAWQARAWYGSDADRIRIRTEGEGRFGEAAEAAEVQALWSHALTPWFDVQAGVRYDWRPEPDRGYAVLGLHGLMPYRFEVDAAAFLSERGDLSVRLEAEYDVLITQRLVLRPAIEVEMASQDVHDLGIGRGISRIEAGLRLRYAIAPELAPYVGVQWERRPGGTADRAQAAGMDRSDLSMIAGVSFWF